MSFEKAAIKLRSIHQEHLLRHWEALDESQRSHLLGQIEALDLEQLRSQQSLLAREAKEPPHNFEAFAAYSSCGQSDDQERGLELIASGRLGCLLVAGGQGTRLGFNGPKGVYPISLIKHKSLFQLFAEKTAAAGKKAGRQLPIAVMTSPLNHAETVNFFQQHGNFGLSELSFFSQSMLPFLDPSGNLFLERPDSIALGPDGNGASLQGLIDAGIWPKWKQSGVQYINYILVDNPLADPFDAELVGFHARRGGEVTVKCTPRLRADEKVGLLVWRGKQLEVVEYSELPAGERSAKLPDGSLKHVCANISLFCFSAAFIDRLQGASLPLHLAYKDVKALHNQAKAWKFEKFIFDVLPIARNVQALMYPREACFAPLKNADDFPRVQNALQFMDRAVYEKIADLPAPDRPFELAQDFYYPTQHLLAEWHHKQLPDQDYISPDSKN